MAGDVPRIFALSAAHRVLDLGMASISLRDMRVEIPIYDTGARSLKKQLLRATTGGRIVRDHGVTVVRAIKGMSLEVRNGDRIGLVGSNGAGKTTLLRVFAGVYEPTGGSIDVQGSVIPLLDIGLGIDYESTGLENILLRGAVLGVKRRDLMALTERIVAFTELGDYLAMPVRTYSSGMILRLAFGISTSVTPEILLLDEFFGVGDSAFLEKAERRLNELVAQAGILVFASHSRELIRRLCNKALWLDKGEVRALGDVETVLEEYAAHLGSQA
jgi:ABC-2 type transport system ATP-binding protein/lipopolysaccharide transport system ATP-binding protein